MGRLILAVLTVLLFFTQGQKVYTADNMASTLDSDNINKNTLDSMHTIILTDFIEHIGIFNSIKHIDINNSKDDVSSHVDIDSADASEPTDIAHKDDIYTDNDIIKESDWEELKEGLFFMNKRETLLLSGKEQNVNMYFVRIDPELYDIDLYGSFLEPCVPSTGATSVDIATIATGASIATIDSINTSNNEPVTNIDPLDVMADSVCDTTQTSSNRSLVTWAKDKNLLIATNASMYLPDYRTSFAYMRLGEVVNNPQIAKSISGFFLSKLLNTETKEEYRQSVRFLEKDEENWEEILKEYKTAVQAYRVISYDSKTKQSKVVWKQDNKSFSMSAYGTDIHGHAYFIYSELPLTVHDFGTYLLGLPSKVVDFKTVLYAEGGSEAALYIQTGKINRLFSSGIGMLFSETLFKLPNILGVTKK